MRPGQAARLEAAIDRLNEPLAPLNSFVLPGGSPAAAWCHLARTVCRRAERDVVTLARAEPINPQVVIYLNRLSDLLFVLARVCNGNGGYKRTEDCSGKGRSCVSSRLNANGRLIPLGCVACTPGQASCSDGKATLCREDGSQVVGHRHRRLHGRAVE